MPFDRPHLADVQFLAQHEATFDDEDFLDNRDDDFGSGLTHRRGFFDLFPDRHATDLVGVAAQRNVDLLHLLGGGPANPDPAGLHNALSDAQTLLGKPQYRRRLGQLFARSFLGY